MTYPYEDVIDKDVFKASPSSDVGVVIWFYVDNGVKGRWKYSDSRVMTRMETT
jgi:hypothetical protein